MKRKLFTVLMVCVSFTMVLFANGGQQPKAASERVWPNFRTIDIVSGTASASGTDAVIRTFVTYISKRFPDVNFNFTNDSGGNGTVAYEKIRNAKPDGSMIYFDSPNLIGNYCFGQYDHSLEEFAIILDFKVPTDNNMIVVAPDSKYKTLQDLVDDAKARPNMVSSPIGVGQLLARAIGIERDLGGVTFRKVAGANTAERVSALLGGYVDFILQPASQTDGYVESGQLRYLAYYGNERARNNPDVPCFAELGFPSKMPETSGHYPILGPKGLSEDICSAVRDIVKDFCADEASREIIYRLEIGYPEFISKEESVKQLTDLQDFYLMTSGKKEWAF